MSTNLNEKTPEELIRIIDGTEDEQTIREAMYNPEADLRVLDAAIERAKEIFEENSGKGNKALILGLVINDILGVFHSRPSVSDKMSPKLLIKIIEMIKIAYRKESSSQALIYYVTEHPNADSGVLDVAFESIEELFEENSGKVKETSRLNWISSHIAGYFPNYSGNVKTSPKLLTKIINKTEDKQILLAALTHKNATAQMIYDCFESLEQDNEVRKDILSIFPYLKHLIGTAEDFELINYKTVFNSQIAKEVAMLYFRDYPTKFSQATLERFSRECGVPVVIDNLENMQQLGMNNTRR